MANGVNCQRAVFITGPSRRSPEVTLSPLDWALDRYWWRSRPRPHNQGTLEKRDPASLLARLSRLYRGEGGCRPRRLKGRACRRSGLFVTRHLSRVAASRGPKPGRMTHMRICAEYEGRGKRRGQAPRQGCAFGHRSQARRVSRRQPQRIGATAASAQGSQNQVGNTKLISAGGSTRDYTLARPRRFMTSSRP
jgi:hypothetical protein